MQASGPARPRSEQTRRERRAAEQGRAEQIPQNTGAVPEYQDWATPSGLPLPQEYRAPDHSAQGYGSEPLGQHPAPSRRSRREEPSFEAMMGAAPPQPPSPLSPLSPPRSDVRMIDLDAAAQPMTRRAARARQAVPPTAPPATAPATSGSLVTRRSQAESSQRTAPRGAGDRGRSSPGPVSRGERRRGSARRPTWPVWVAVSSAIVAAGAVALYNVGGADGVVTLLTAQSSTASEPEAGTRSAPLPSVAPGRLPGTPSGKVTVRSSGVPSAAARAARPPAATKSAAAAAAGRQGMQMYGTPRSGLAWQSGWWQGGQMDAAAANAAGTWRGRPMDFATTYPEYDTWAQMADSASSVTMFKGFSGRLAYGLPLLPIDRKGQWGDVTSGSKDEVFRTIARQLRDNGFGDSAVRVGLEANGTWYAHSANADTAVEYKAAFRRVVSVMRAEAPKLTFWFDLSVSAQPLTGTSGRADVLNVLFPGADVVDGISMDHYDFYSLVARTDAEFDAAVRPQNGVGLADAADFARAHKIGFSAPEWGLHSVQGAGDNPFFIRKMFAFFTANRDVLVFENYFNEPDAYIGSALKEGQNPKSAAAYRELWGGR